MNKNVDSILGKNENVRKKVYEMIRFWLNKGVDGFRLDVINLISKDQRFLNDDGSDTRFVPDGRRFYTDGPRIHEFLKEILEAGNDVLFVDMTRALSSSINNAERAIKSLSEEFPDRKISLLDSYCVTGGLALFLKQLVKRHEEGWDYDQVVEWGNAHKFEYIHRFMVEDLQWLRRGGRLSNASALLGTILSIKPLIYIPDSGKLVSFKQVRGRKKALHSLIDSCADDIADYTKDEEILIIHADAYEDAVAFIEAGATRIGASSGVAIMKGEKASGDY